MPYTKITELPKQFKNLPDGAKKIALEVINSVLEKGGDDESAMMQAWGAIKKSYEKNDNNQWVKLGELETVNIEGVEIMAVGTWDGYPKTVSYTKKDLDAMVSSFDELSKDGLHEAPVKLGHDSQQKLLQKDGYPSAGWVSNLRRVGKKLVADFRDVPKKIGEIINSRGYKKVSSEIYFDKEIGGKKYDLVLKAVSLLGGDIPAVKTLDDVRALYGEDAGEDEVVVTYSWEADEGIVSLDEILAGIDAILSKAEGTIKGKVGSPAIRTYLKEVKAKLKTLLDKEVKHSDSLDDKVNVVRDAFDKQYRGPGLMPDYPSYGYVAEVFDDHIILEVAREYYKIGYSWAGDQITFDYDNKVKVKKVYEEITEHEDTFDCECIKCGHKMQSKEHCADLTCPECGGQMRREERPGPGQGSEQTDNSIGSEGADSDNENKDKEAVMLKELIKELGLGEETSEKDALEAVKGLKAKADKDGKTVSLKEYEGLSEKVTTLTTILAERDRDALVGKALREGKITPAQKESYDKLALDSPALFTELMEKQPRVVSLEELGGDDKNTGEVELTEAEKKAAEKLGVSEDDLLEQKKKEKAEVS